MTPEQELLVTENLQIVHKVVNIVARSRRLPNSVDREDLRAVGYVGLVEAAIRFELVKNDSFAGYAWRRVQGSILDYLRAASPDSRGEWKKIKAGQRTPTRFASDTVIDYHVSIIFVPVDGFIWKRVAELPAPMPRIVRLYYVEQLQMKQIGVLLGISESRVSQLLSKAHRKLKQRMKVCGE